ncbi:hypothetical protein GCM10022419_082470 [Nonomuraea rosea]|uniref:Threonine/serine exporter-like N-terminal domain-containing protein n=1 Tax=Nonomuraea rosea TaxID=638574 RepID=A0ABP6YP02_9ACTN
MTEQADRAISLSLRVGELLPASGEATENVTGAMRTILRAYGLRQVETDVNLSTITLSHVPDGEPTGRGLSRVAGGRRAVARRGGRAAARLGALSGMLKLSLGDLPAGMRNLVEALSIASGIGTGVILGAEALRAVRRRDVSRRIRPASRRTRGY